MNLTQIGALIAGATALVVALGHLVADVNGTMDKLRKTPIQQQPAPTPPPGQPGGQ